MATNTLGPIPWYSSGLYLGNRPGLSTEEVARLSGFDVPVTLEPVFLESGAKIESQWATVKNGRGLSVVGDRYTPVQETELLAFGDTITQVTGQRFDWHTLGHLKGGRRAFAVAQLSQVEEIRRGDPVVNMLALATTHDGSSRVVAFNLVVRTSCWNAIRAFMAGGMRDAMVALRHTASVQVRLEQARETVALAAAAFSETTGTLRLLQGRRMNGQELRGFVSQVLTDLDDEREALAKVAASTGRERTMYENRGTELVSLFSTGLGNKGETAWDALNAVTEWVDHQRSRSATWRAKSAALGLGADSAVFGHGAQVKSRALQLLIKRAA